MPIRREVIELTDRDKNRIEAGLEHLIKNPSFSRKELLKIINDIAQESFELGKKDEMDFLKSKKEVV